MSIESSKVEADVRERGQIPERYRWNLQDIYSDWESWGGACERLEQLIEAYAALKGTLTKGPEAMLKVMTLGDELGQLTYTVYFYPSLCYDEDQRDNEINAHRQRSQILIAKSVEASAWFNPELLAIPLETIRQWMDQNEQLAGYRFAVEEVYRQQEHVLDDSGERLMSLGARFRSTPGDVYGALTTADVKFPTITLRSGEEVTVTHGRYRAILATNRSQQDRAAAFSSLYGVYQDNINTYASLYNAVCQRDWFVAQARDYSSTLSAALHGNNIPETVVETLITTTREGVAPLRRYHQLRRRVLGLERYHLYDGMIPLLELERKYPYDDVLDWIVTSVATLGTDYQQQMTRGFSSRWIDVYENKGKRSGAYSAGVYGVHPYMLLNYNDTLDDMFTLAHEMGHSMHTILSHEHQPFVYASYTIFIAEVASTLNEALLLDYLLGRTDDPQERAVLLQHAIDSICGTFYTQVLFADWELQVHRLVEQGQPLTADSLSILYRQTLEHYYGDAIDQDEMYGLTWARIPHLFRAPFYVYQYATCFASSAKILQSIQTPSGADREQAVQRYLTLLEAGSSDHPMDLLRRAGVDLGERGTVQAVVDHLDALVGRLEQDLARC